MAVLRVQLTDQLAGNNAELVKGQEREFLAQLRPLVQCGPVQLDLSAMERIDAAGLAALVTLYREAQKAGHEFAVINPSRRVARIIALVGLERILLGNAPEDLAVRKQCIGLAAA